MTPSPTQSLIDACQIIPRGKIKAQLQKRKDTGKIPKSTEDYLRCCTVLFLQSLLPKPDETLTTGQQASVVTLEDIRESASRYSFIDLSQISEENASKKKKKKKRKVASKKTKQIETTATTTTKTKKEIQIAIQPLTGNMDPDFQPTMQVMEDDDDYD
jgi:hypothetical protein